MTDAMKTAANNDQPARDGWQFEPETRIISQAMYALAEEIQSGDGVAMRRVGRQPSGWMRRRWRLQGYGRRCGLRRSRWRGRFLLSRGPSGCGRNISLM